MKRSQLKQVIKPIVKECITESLIEEGILSNIIAEVMRGVQASNPKQNIIEKKTEYNRTEWNEKYLKRTECNRKENIT